jgi:molybdate transport system substrate-binding protein
MSSWPFPRALMFLALLGLAACGPAEEDRGPLVLAPSSMQEAIEAAADAWAAQGHPRPVVSFAGTPSLARQVLQGAPADLFISADEQWMDELERAGPIDAESRAAMAGNRLVLVSPQAQAEPLPLQPQAFASALGDGPLALADPASVPAGRYGKAALEHLGLWPTAEGNISASENVRAALALVQRGEARLGLVYASDANAAPGVAVVAELPEASHPPIRYPVALLAHADDPDAASFRTFLLSPEGQAILRRHGFTAP